MLTSTSRREIRPATGVHELASSLVYSRLIGRLKPHEREYRRVRGQRNASRPFFSVSGRSGASHSLRREPVAAGAFRRGCVAFARE